MDTQTDQSPQSGKGGKKSSPVLWVLIGISLLLMGAGIAWGVMTDDPAEAGLQTLERDSLPEGIDPNLIGGFAPGTLPRSGQTSSEQPTELEADTLLGPDSVFRLGFGFAMGFGIAFALKKLFKLTIAAGGLVMLLLMGMQHAGLIEIHWGAMAARYDSVQDWAIGQFSSAQAFVTGAVPMTATALAGLAAGWKAG